MNTCSFNKTIKLFDALLFTSKGEGFGMVLLEAMIMGVPVFAINDGAVPEIIRHKENGILLDTINPKALAQQILELFEEQVIMKKTKVQGMRDVHNKFSMEVSAKQLEKIYEDIL